MQIQPSQNKTAPRRQPNDTRPASPMVRVVRRQEIPTIHSVVVDGQIYQLGLLKTFRKNGFLDQFIPQQGRPSIGWVALKPDETLEVHRHPIASVIVITKGSGALLNSPHTPIEEGDVVCVPPGAEHGFVGRGQGGFWALSLQFEDRGLYEDAANPLVEFGKDDGPNHWVSKLQDRNDRLLAQFMQQPLFAAFKDGRYDQPERKARLVAALQVWSNHFHKMLLLRSASCDHPAILSVFDEHLKDEFSHSEELSEERSSVRPPWDAELNAACSWFVGQMSTLDNVEKIVLVHMVTECAATGFYSAASSVLAAEAKNHIEAHAEHDCEHARMGTDLLQDINASTYQKLCQVQDQGWAMLGVILARIHALGMSPP